MSKSKWNVVSPMQLLNNTVLIVYVCMKCSWGLLSKANPGTQMVSPVFQVSLKNYGDYSLLTANFEVSSETANPKELKSLHKTIKKVTEDIERFSFNTSVSTFHDLCKRTHRLKMQQKRNP